MGLVAVDVVTDRAADFHPDLIGRIGAGRSGITSSPLYAAAYRPLRQADSSTVDVWYQPVSIGEPLPTVPLWLRYGLGLPVELDASYERTCGEQRLAVTR